MDYDEFVRKDWRGSFSLDDLRNLFIATVGLSGETGEVSEHLKKWIRNGRLDKEALALELGDVLFYLTVISHMAGYSLKDIQKRNIDKLTARNAVSDPNRSC